MHVIGEETSERLDVIPAQFRAIVTHRPKYACRACEQAVVQAPAPERLIKGGLPTEAMVASVLVAKYAWHLPLYRQGADAGGPGHRHQAIGPGVLGGLCGGRAHAALSAPARTHSRLRQDRGRRDDGAGARSRPRPHQAGYFWAIARDDRPWGGTDPPAVVYTYAPGRGAVHALKLLDGYRGIVQCDGYAAYKKLAAEAPGEAITLAFCWAHLRRRFFDIAKAGNAPIASEALDRIAALYAIEKTIRGASAEERRSGAPGQGASR